MNIKTGKWATRGDKRQRRVPGQPTPCRACPRGSPEEGERLALDHRQMTTIRLYLQVRATSGACLNEWERGDALLLRNLALIDLVWRQYEGDRASVNFATSFASLFPRRKRADG